MERAQHLFEVQIPMLFLQGTHDEFAELDLLQPLIEQLGGRATLKLVQDGDHSFRVPARTGRTAAQVTSEILGAASSWMETVVLGTAAPRAGSNLNKR